MEIELLIEHDKDILDDLQLYLFSLGYKWLGGETDPIDITHGISRPNKHIRFYIRYDRKSMTYDSTPKHEYEYRNDFTNKKHIIVKSTNVLKMKQFLNHGTSLPVYVARTIIKNI